MYQPCTIQISFQYLPLFTEVLLNDAASTEVAIEDGVFPLLIQLFGEGVLLEMVTIRDALSNSEADTLIYQV